jgi:hypothetical protein
MTCHYERIIYPANATSQSTSHLAKGNDECSALVASANVHTAENLPGGQFPSLRYADLGRPCQFAAESPSENFGLYECRTGNGYLDDMIVTTKTRDLAVLRLPEREKGVHCAVTSQHEAHSCSLRRDRRSHLALDFA